MSEKLIRMTRTEPPAASRPVMLGIAGDSAAGKSTLARGLVEALGSDRCQCIRADDYHRYSREERRALGITPLDPACNYIDILEQHLQLLALGRPVLKPVYDHGNGTLESPEYVSPGEFVVIEGLHTLQTKLTRACFDITVFVDPPEDLRRRWKVERDTRDRGYDSAAVVAELRHREPESALFIRTQRRYADVVARFTPQQGGADQPAMTAELLLRPTIRHPGLGRIIAAGARDVMDLRIIRDGDGTPTDSLLITAEATADDLDRLRSAVRAEQHCDTGRNGTAAAGRGTPLGVLDSGERSIPLAMVQLLLLHHLVAIDHGDGATQPAPSAPRRSAGHP